MERYRLSFVFLVALIFSGSLFGVSELRMALHSSPRTLDPARADDDASSVVRYLTGGELRGVIRQGPTLTPEMGAASQVLGRAPTIRVHPTKQRETCSWY